MNSTSTGGRVALVQMRSTTDWRANLETTARLLREAAATGAVMALLPENFAVFNTAQLVARGRAEAGPEGPIRAFLAEQAARHGLWVVAGSLPIAAAGGQRVRAASLVFDDQGRQRARYDKIHLFDVAVADAQGAYLESEQIEPGDQALVVATPLGRLGLSICYDLRFPHLYQRLTAAGAELLSVPSAFTQVTGEAHWEPLLRARAIENQCWVLAPNQSGRHSSKRLTHGHSMVVDPWGRVACMKAYGEGVLCADLDLTELREVRQRMPVAEHARDPGAAQCSH